MRMAVYVVCMAAGSTLGKIIGCLIPGHTSCRLAVMALSFLMWRTDVSSLALRPLTILLCSCILGLLFMRTGRILGWSDLLCPTL